MEKYVKLFVHRSLGRNMGENSVSTSFKIHDVRKSFDERQKAGIEGTCVTRGDKKAEATTETL
jgi:hypothetical protein